MVDVSAKQPTVRTARARARIAVGRELPTRLCAGELPKGDAIAVARIAGIQAAKSTAQLIPLCHPLPLTAVDIAIEPHGDDAIEILASVRCTGVTGVEMEALTAASVAALALYDMCKSFSKAIRISDVELLEKTGGKSGDWRRDEATDQEG